MKRALMMAAFLFLITLGAQAQNMGKTYKTALGLKVWDGAGVSFKTFLVPKNALELIGYFNNSGARFTGLYEIHGNIEGAGGLKWYVGPGAHIGFYNAKSNGGISRTVAGIDGVLGLDFKINGAPINLSLDWQPSFEFANNTGFVGSWGGLGFRYTF